MGDVDSEGDGHWLDLRGNVAGIRPGRALPDKDAICDGRVGTVGWATISGGFALFDCIPPTNNVTVWIMVNLKTYSGRIAALEHAYENANGIDQAHIVMMAAQLEKYDQEEAAVEDEA